MVLPPGFGSTWPQANSIPANLPTRQRRSDRLDRIALTMFLIFLFDYFKRGVKSARARVGVWYSWLAFVSLVGLEACELRWRCLRIRLAPPLPATSVGVRSSWQARFVLVSSSGLVGKWLSWLAFLPPEVAGPLALSATRPKSTRPLVNSPLSQLAQCIFTQAL